MFHLFSELVHVIILRRLSVFYFLVLLAHSVIIMIEARVPLDHRRGENFFVFEALGENWIWEALVAIIDIKI